jgi:hypothetical protein
MNFKLGGIGLGGLGGGGKLYELIFFNVSIYEPIKKLSILFACLLKIIVSSKEVKNRILSGVRDEELMY